MHRLRHAQISRRIGDGRAPAPIIRRVRMVAGVQDWIDVTERRRSYLFTWHNFVAIEAGIASPQQARVPIRRLLVSLAISGGASFLRREALHARPIAVQAAQIMRAVDAQRAAAAVKFNLSLAQLWCTPSNFVPLAPDDNLYCQVGAGRPL
jgi:hypothetical protein